MNERKKELDDILKNYRKNDITNIHKKLKNKYNNDLEGYSSIFDLKKLKVGNFLKYINLSMDEIKYGIIVNFTYFNTSKKSVKLIHLKNTKNNNIWKIKPSKNYIFQKKNKNRSNLTKLIDEYLLNINSEK